MSSEFTHLARGHAAMVDVTRKVATHRKALASCKVVDVTASIADLRGTKGNNVLSAARIAGLGAAKQTSSLIPLCHPLPLTGLDLNFKVGSDSVEVIATTETIGQTGVEMEALTACAIAALTVLCAVRAKDPLAFIDELTLWEKSGGRSGTWKRSSDGVVTNQA